MSIQQAERVDEKLVRGIGVPALTANIVSSTIGAGIFVIPATVAKGLGCNVLPDHALQDLSAVRPRLSHPHFSRARFIF